MQSIALIGFAVRSFRAVIGGMYVKCQVLVKAVHLTGKRVARGEFRAVTFGIARICIGLRANVFRYRAFIRKLYAADLIHAPVVIDGIQNIQPLGIRQAYLKLKEPAFIACPFGIVEKFQCILGIALLIPVSELNFVPVRRHIKGDVLRIIHIDIQSEIFLPVRIVGIAELNEGDYLRLSAVAMWIVRDVEFFPADGAAFQIVQNVRVLVCRLHVGGGKSGQVALPAHDRAETHKQYQQERRKHSFYVPYRHVLPPYSCVPAKMICSGSSVTPVTSAPTLRSMR